MNYNDWNNYIPHKLCKSYYEGVSNHICRQCMFKFWWDLAGYYGNDDARLKLEGQYEGGGGGVSPVSGGTDSDKHGPTPTDPSFNEECIDDKA